MLDPDSFRIVILRRIHVAIVFGDKVGHVLFDAVWIPQGNVFPGVDKIVEGVDVLQEFASREISHPSGLPRGIQLSCQGIGLRIEIMIVRGFIDSHAPKND